MASLRHRRLLRINNLVRLGDVDVSTRRVFYRGRLVWSYLIERHGYFLRNNPLRITQPRYPRGHRKSWRRHHWSAEQLEDLELFSHAMKQSAPPAVPTAREIRATNDRIRMTLPQGWTVIPNRTSPKKLEWSHG